MNRKCRSDHRNRNSGLYHLLLRLPRKVRIRVGALGLHLFLPGYYIYTGSAKQGLTHRIARHLRKRKKHHWHIDFLTTVVRVERILIDDTGRYAECRRHQAIMDRPGAKVIVAGFGSSDCRCRSHLAYFKKRPRLPDLPRSERFSIIIPEERPRKS